MKIIGTAVQTVEGNLTREVITFGEVATITRVLVEKERCGSSNYDLHRIAKGDTMEIYRDTVEVSGNPRRLAAAIAAVMPAYADLADRMHFEHEPSTGFDRLYEAAKFVAAGVRDYRGRARKATPLDF